MELPIIQNKIFEVRGQKVMLDFDLAELYEVETRALKQAVKRNIDRFPADFMFQLLEDEANGMVSQNVIPSKSYLGGALPFAFTELGVAMLSSILKSKKALQANMAIMRAFIAMKQIIINTPYKELTDKLNLMFERLGEHDVQLNQIYESLENMLDKETDKAAEKIKWQERERIGFKK